MAGRYPATPRHSHAAPRAAPSAVMAGLDPATHAFLLTRRQPAVMAGQ